MIKIDNSMTTPMTTSIKPKSIQTTQTPKQNIDGFLLLDKDQGISSNTAMQRIKRLFQAKKAGHCGCLDPLATGLLPICLGQACKFSQYLIDADKTYEVTAELGVTTTTGDSEGDVLAVKSVPTLSFTDIESTCQRFLGPQQQVPPMYSALKHQGKPLYRYARAGQSIDRAARAITLYACDVLDFSASVIKLRVTCSKGTYIRTLIEDIGALLGCGAHVTALRRTAIGDLPAEGMLTEAAWSALDAQQRLSRLQPIDFAVRALPKMSLTDEVATRFSHGQKLSGFESITTDSVAVYDTVGHFLGVAAWSDCGLLCPKRLLAPTVNVMYNSGF